MPRTNTDETRTKTGGRSEGALPASPSRLLLIRVRSVSIRGFGPFPESLSEASAGLAGVGRRGVAAVLDDQPADAGEDGQAEDDGDDAHGDHAAGDGAGGLLGLGVGAAEVGRGVDAGVVGEGV